MHKRQSFSRCSSRQAEIRRADDALRLARQLLSRSPMRNPLLLTSAIAFLALTACGGSSEPAKSPDDSEHAAEKASDAADKAEDKADKAADKASDAASDADKAEKEKESK